MILLQGCVLLFLLLCPLSSCPACRPAQQLGWIATAKVELRGVRGDGMCHPVMPLCQWHSALCLLHLDSVLTVTGHFLKKVWLGITNPWRQEHVVPVNREYKEKIAIYPGSILSSMAAPATDKRVWIHCLCVAKVITLLCSTFWNQTAWMEYEMLGGKLESILKIFPWQNE